jgi:hypothetical protein
MWSYTGPATSDGLTEQFYAKPLVFTPVNRNQTVFAFSEKNRLYALDAINGSLIAFRDLGSEGEIPFNVADLAAAGGGQCNDITDTIGVTGTPVIDPSTDTIFFWAKSYRFQGASGWQNGAYYFHAVDAVTLQERPGFPTSIEGVPAINDNTRVFTGGTVLQRPSLTIVNGAIISGFGGHCTDPISLPLIILSTDCIR